MKKYLLMLLVLLPLIANSQELDSAKVGFPVKNGKVVYESIVDIDGVSKETIYAASKKWLADAFVNSKAVVQSEDRETGQLMGKGSATTSSPTNTWILANITYNLSFNIQINCKDNRYRIRFYDITSNTGAFGGYLTAAEDVPIETFAFYAPAKPLKPKQLERVKSSKDAINNVFTMLLSSFNTSVKTYKQDDF